MDNDEKIAKQYLLTLYEDRDICFEPNGYKTYPDFICQDKYDYEVTGLYPVSFDTPVIESERPILCEIERLVKKYNKHETGYYLDITIDGGDKLSQTNLEKWFKQNDQEVSQLQFDYGCLSIELLAQAICKEKYVIAGVMNHNDPSWLLSAHLDAIEHAALKKAPKMSKGTTLVLVNHVYPGTVTEVHEINNHYEFGIIVVDIKGKKQYEWPVDSN